MKKTPIERLRDKGQFTTGTALTEFGFSDNSAGRRKLTAALSDAGFVAERKGRSVMWKINQDAAAAAEPQPATVLSPADFDRIAAIAREMVHGPVPQHEPTGGVNIARSIYEVQDPDELKRHIQNQELTNSALQEHRDILGRALSSFVERHVGALLSAGVIRVHEVQGRVSDELQKVDGLLEAATRKIEALRPVPPQQALGVAGNDG